MVSFGSLLRFFGGYWKSLLRAQGPTPGYAALLSEERRPAQREQIRTALPSAQGGSISLWRGRGQCRVYARR